MPATDFLAVIRTLTEHRVDFIVVDGVAAVLEGAPISTFDLDIVHSRTGENVQRLVGALNALDAHFRLQPERRIRPAASHLLSAGHQLLMTRYGPLDVLGAIGQSHGYDELLEHVNEMSGTRPLDQSPKTREAHRGEIGDSRREGPRCSTDLAQDAGRERTLIDETR